MIPISDDNPTSRRPYVTILLMAACVLVFLWQLSLDPRTGQLVVYHFGFVPGLLFGGDSFGADAGLVPSWATMITSMFLHGSMMHLAGNMLYLWIFGNNIEDVMGHGRYLMFYLTCGLIAALVQALPDPGSTVPMIGASGAISGVLGAYLLLFPKVKVRVIIPVGILIPYTLPAAWLLGLWIGFQVISGLSSGIAGGGVAWWAHVGGFVAGMILLLLFRPTAAPPPTVRIGAAPTAPAKPKGRSRIPESGPSGAPADRKGVSRPPEPPTLSDRPTVQRRHDPH